MSKLMQSLSVAALTAAILVAGAVYPARAASDSATYTYDALGRVTSVTYANGTTITYAYDAAGNREQVTVTCGGSGC